MANTKISDLAAVTDVLTTDEYVLARSGTSYKIDATDLLGLTFSHTEITSAVNLTATTEATANTIITAPSMTLDGSTTVEIEFYTPQFQSPGGAVSRFSAITLYQSFNGGSAASLSSFWAAIVTNLNGSIQAPCLVKRFLTPAAGDYVWSARGYVTAGTGVVQAGAGGSGNYMPAYLRVTQLR